MCILRDHTPPTGGRVSQTGCTIHLTIHSNKGMMYNNPLQPVYGLTLEGRRGGRLEEEDRRQRRVEKTSR